MAKTGTVGLSAALAAVQREADEIETRLGAIAKEEKDLLKRRSALMKRLGIDVADVAERPKGKRGPGRPRAEEGKGRKGREGRTASKDGRSIKQILVEDVLPTAKNADGSDNEGMTREQAYAELQKHGVSSSAENPSIVVGQAFTSLRGENLIKAVSRGHWVLSARGEKRRDNLRAAAEKAKAEAADAKDAQTDAAPAEQSEPATVNEGK